ncbi:3-hydroxyisobutyrate dehydrogenase [Deinococcus aquiradiocola]|uniref:3-hydroxyisobutyrate dehydrogenase n=2 Tax=Deinococcus aquiradiocola TaxID=393059 RepID=A0A917PF31_9DEIO|nr:3-hydroxyisobutyrate dehydrogenase [Deinococcus aquiradiocola]
MGVPMAAHVARTVPTRVWNRTFSRAEAHAAEFGSTAAALEDAAGADVIFSCLPTSAEVDACIGQMLPFLRRGAVWVDCTSGRPAAAREQAARLAEVGVAFVDAPVSGGPAGARAGTLAVMVGGDEAVFGRVRALLDSFGGTVLRVGPVGSGFAVKAVNNVLMGLHLLSVAEGLASLKKQGVDLAPALTVLNASSGSSFSSQNKVAQQVFTRQFSPMFKLGLLAKDAGIALENVQEVQGSAPLIAQTAMMLRAAQQMIGSDVDHTEAVRLLEALNGVELS